MPGSDADFHVRNLTNQAAQAPDRRMVRVRKMTRRITRSPNNARQAGHGRAGAPLTVALLLVMLVGMVLSGCSPAPDAATPPDADLPARSGSTIASAAPTSADPPARTRGEVITATTFGMHVDGVQRGAWPDYQVGSIRLWDNGTAWSQVQIGADTFAWDALDTAVVTATDAGLQDIVLVLGSTPTWAAVETKEKDYPVPGAAAPPRDPTRWDAWVEAVTTRYAGRIGAYEVWNEADLPAMWRGTPQQMADLTTRAARIIRRNDPAALVVGASTGLRTAAHDRFFGPYLSALAAQGWPVDVLPIHGYPPALATPDDRYRLLQQVSAEIRASGAPDRIAVWDTEVNYGLAGPGTENPHTDITGDRAAAWVVRTFLDSLRSGISRTYPYIWTPEPYAILGVQFGDGSPGARGFDTARRWLSGATWNGCSSAADITTCRLQRGQEPAAVLWSQTPESTEAPQWARFTCTANGNCDPVVAGQRIRLGTDPLWIGSRELPES